MCLKWSFIRCLSSLTSWLRTRLKSVGFIWEVRVAVRLDYLPIGSVFYPLIRPVWGKATPELDIFIVVCLGCKCYILYPVPLLEMWGCEAGLATFLFLMLISIFWFSSTCFWSRSFDSSLLVLWWCRLLLTSMISWEVWCFGTDRWLRLSLERELELDLRFLADFELSCCFLVEELRDSFSPEFYRSCAGFGDWVFLCETTLPGSTFFS